MARTRYHLITYGCQMNTSDSERISSVLDRMGMAEVAAPEDADLILINSCSVRQSAEDRIFGNLRNFAAFKARNPKLIIGITGCLPGRDKDGSIRKKMPLVDLYFPIKDLMQLPRWIVELNPDLGNEGDLEEDYLKVKPRYSNERQAYVTIQTGCNKFCTYCVVPFSRGLEQNRPVEDIVHEVRERAARGTVEVTLLGQTVNSYRTPEGSSFSSGNPYSDHFAALLWEVNAIEGIERIHYTAPHPVHMTDEVIDALTLPKAMNFLQIPVQSGSSAMLKRMNRRYDRDLFLNMMKRVYAKKPDIAVGTDIIVGFCGETEEMFQDTVTMYKEADFDVSYTAIYSPRSGTAAYKAFKDDVPHDVKKRRWWELQGVMEQNTLRKNQTYVGRTVEVLVENWEHGVASGNSREMKLVRFNSKRDLRGATVTVDIVKGLQWALSGTLAEVLREPDESTAKATLTV